MSFVRRTIRSATRLECRTSEDKSRDQLQTGLDKEIHSAQHCHFHFRALLKPSAEEIVPQIEVGFNPYVSLAQGHKGCCMQDLGGSQVMQL
jgi:hypothetical protein